MSFGSGHEGDPSVERESNIFNLERLVADFESEHDLEALHAIEDGQEAMTSEIRRAARLDLAPIVKILRALEGDARHPEMREKYMKLSRAVGMINSGRVDHTRT